jgi:spermidine synthase
MDSHSLSAVLGTSAGVKKFERLEETRAPDGTVLTLYRHDGAYFIRVNGMELMSTRRHHSEDRLAEVVCAPLSNALHARVLIGGLGLGFTLRAALALLGANAQVVVAEILEDVIAWNRHPGYDLAGDALADARVELRRADVVRVLEQNAGSFDGIMLDVDNGAEPLTTAGNARLYRDEGIQLAVRALRPDGCLAYWSAERDSGFERALRRAGLSVDTERVRAHATSGGWYTLYLARRGR